jgi:hypothetical protein
VRGTGLHQRLSKQSGWAGFVGPVPVVPGTVIRIQVERLPGDRAAQDLWLWHATPLGTAAGRSASTRTGR